jgi:hypothetical protein
MAGSGCGSAVIFAKDSDETRSSERLHCAHRCGTVYDSFLGIAGAAADGYAVAFVVGVSGDGLGCESGAVHSTRAASRLIISRSVTQAEYVESRQAGL